MSRRYGLQTAESLFDKLGGDAALLEDEVTSARAFNFVITAYHLREWVERDLTGSYDSGALVKLEQSEAFRACRDLANESKHFELDPSRNPNPTVASTNSRRGWGLGRYGKGPYGVGEEEIGVELAGGRILHILELVEILMAAYSEVFGRRPASV